ncbi:MAG: hypothetical protein LC791_02280 [Acidobacteria bacterium]|nr:hypothetical protein [Acidobacteriota bacterium]
MTDDELRTLVRDAVARHLGTTERTPSSAAAPTPPWRAHPSFGRFLIPSGAEQDGPCLIEPTVRCNHCGFCQSYGH